MREKKIKFTPNLCVYLLAIGTWVIALSLYLLRNKLASYTGLVAGIHGPVNPVLLFFIIIPVTIFSAAFFDLKKLNMMTVYRAALIIIPSVVFIYNVDVPDMVNHSYHQLLLVTGKRYDIKELDSYTAQNPDQNNMIIYIGEKGKDYWDRDRRFLQDIAGRQPVQITSFDRRLDNPASIDVIKGYKLSSLPRVVVITDGKVSKILPTEDVSALETVIHEYKIYGRYFDKL